MSDTAGGTAVLVIIAVLLATPIALARCRRQPQEVVTTGSAHGRPGMAIDPGATDSPSPSRGSWPWGQALGLSYLAACRGSTRRCGSRGAAERWVL